ncbi:hypothetical protein L9F63_011036, partial [Diploptera punctata]
LLYKRNTDEYCYVFKNLHTHRMPDLYSRETGWIPVYTILFWHTFSNEIRPTLTQVAGVEGRDSTDCATATDNLKFQQNGPKEKKNR